MKSFVVCHLVAEKSYTTNAYHLMTIDLYRLRLKVEGNHVLRILIFNSKDVKRLICIGLCFAFENDFKSKIFFFFLGHFTTECRSTIQYICSVPMTDSTETASPTAKLYFARLQNNILYESLDDSDAVWFVTRKKKFLRINLTRNQNAIRSVETRHNGNWIRYEHCWT